MKVYETRSHEVFCNRNSYCVQTKQSIKTYLKLYEAFFWFAQKTFLKCSLKDMKSA